MFHTFPVRRSIALQKEVARQLQFWLLERYHYFRRSIPQARRFHEAMCGDLRDVPCKAQEAVIRLRTELGCLVRRYTPDKASPLFDIFEVVGPPEQKRYWWDRSKFPAGDVLQLVLSRDVDERILALNEKAAGAFDRSHPAFSLRDEVWEPLFGVDRDGCVFCYLPKEGEHAEDSLTVSTYAPWVDPLERTQERLMKESLNKFGAAAARAGQKVVGAFDHIRDACAAIDFEHQFRVRPQLARAELEAGLAATVDTEAPLAEPPVEEQQEPQPVSRERFAQLAEQWLRETLLVPVDQIPSHPAYREIVSMGLRVVPWILECLEQEPNHWFAALEELTGENPVDPSHRGDLQAMAEDWLDWASPNVQLQDKFRVPVSSLMGS